MATDKRELLLVIKGKDQGAKKVLDDVGDSAEGAKDDLSDMQVGLKKLDGQIADSTKKVEALRKEIGRSGDLALVKDLEKAQRELNKLTRQRKLLIPVELDVDKDSLDVGDLVDAGGRGAGGFAVGFSQRIGPLIARSPLSPQLLGTAAAAAPIIAQTVGAAISGGAALGAVGLGVALAAQNEKVKQAGASLGKDLMTSLSRDADVFVQPVLDGIDELREGFDRVEPNIQRAFRASAKHVPVLARAVADAADLAAEDFADIVENADPVVDVFAEHIPKAIGVTTQALKDLSSGSEDNAKTLDTIFTAAEISIGGTGKALEGLAKIGAITTSYQQDLFQAITNTDSASKAATGSTAGWDAGFRAFANSTARVNSELETYSEMVDRLTNENLSAEQATIDLQEAIDDATAAAKKNTDGISTNTEKGRANRQILIDLAEKSNNAAQKIYEQTHSQEAANAAAEQGRKAFIAAAIGMGASSAEAERLAGMLFAIPSPNPKVTLNTAQALARAKVLQDEIDGLHGKNISIGIYFQTHGRNAGDLKVPGGHLVKDRWGGMHTPMAMAAGGTIGAGIYSASNPPLVQFAEPGTGGEAYIPKNGNLARSRAIAEEVVEGWLGGSVSWANSVRRATHGGGGYGGVPGAGMGGDTVKFDITIRWPNGEVAGHIVSNGFRAGGGAPGFHEAIRTGKVKLAVKVDQTPIRVGAG